MDSVYKLTKYSQKIDEACRSKQLDKVIEYNKHELTYINKLSKYFGNQKGGATVDDVIAVIDTVLREAQDKVNGLTESNKLAIVTIKERDEQIKTITKQLENKIEVNKEDVERITELETENKSLNEQIKTITQQLTDASSNLEVQVASQAQGGSKKTGKK